MNSNSDAQYQDGPPTSPADSRHSRPPLRRAAHGRMLAGVAAGLARYLGIDVTIVRIAFVVLGVLALAGDSLGVAGIPFYLAGIPLYLACWLLVPEDGEEHSIAAHVLGSGQSRPR